MSNRNGWVSEPQVTSRGTASIIYTCFFTIYACTWSALHLNVTRRGLHASKKFLRKVQWMVIAILAPEYITLTALTQRSSTITVLSDKWPLEDRSRELVYYALMGGFELRFNDGTDHRLTYSEFSGLLRARLIDPPNITAEDIRDKSKGNWFSKSLALLQIGWFVAQLLGRVLQSLQTTPLELFTLGVVACTMVSYLNWWAKPLDVNTATAMTMASGQWLSKETLLAPLEVYRAKEGTPKPYSDIWLTALRTFVPPSISPCIDQHQERASFASELQFGVYDDRNLPTFLALQAQETPQSVIEVLGGLPLLTPDAALEWERYRDGIAALKSIDRAVSRIDIIRWGRHRDFFFADQHTRDERRKLTGPRPGGFWSEAFFEDRVTHTSSTLGFTFTCLAFGACHLLAWNYSFPSLAERVLWQVMSIFCTVVPLVILIVDNGASWVKGLREKRRARMKSLQENNNLPPSKKKKSLTKTTMSMKHFFTQFYHAYGPTLLAALTSYTSSFILFMLYMICRLYPLIAILISLRSVPESVYTTVDWSRYIPHFE